MKINADADVMAVAAFMQATLPATKLVAVAQAIDEIAPLLWGRYAREPITPLSLAADPISGCDQRTQSCATE